MSINLSLVLFTAFCFSANALFMKLAGGKLDSYSAVLFWALGALVAGAALFTWQKFNSQVSISFSGGSFSGGSFSFIAGFLMSLGVLAYISAFNRGADFSFVTPIVNITVVITGVSLGYLIFKEDFSIYRMLGLTLGVISILFLARG